MSLKDFYLRCSEGGWCLREILFSTVGMSGDVRCCVTACFTVGDGWRKVNTGRGGKESASSTSGGYAL